VATGEQHSVREFCRKAFACAGIDLVFRGEGVNEKGFDKKSGECLVEVDPKYFRPAEVETLLGDPTKAKSVLGWNPTKTPFDSLVQKMMAHDMEYVKNERTIHGR
jgi:GDPmannose 4,6-dehydratase